MRKLLTKISMVMLALIIGLSPILNIKPVLADILYENNIGLTTYSTDDNGIWGANYNSQSFKATSTHTFNTIELYVSATAVADSTLYIKLYDADGNSKPTGAALYTTSVNTSVLPHSLTYYKFDCGGEWSVTSGNYYCIVVSIPGMGQYGVNWRFQNTTDAYADGTRYYSGNSGSTWAASGKDHYFALYDNVPEVTTDAATSITATTAILNGTLDTLGIEAHGHAYFGYDEGGGPAYDHYTSPVFKDTLGAYSSNLTGLTPETKYYFTAFIWNAGETISYSGSELNFTTLSQTVVETKPATSITVTTATLNGDLTDLGEETDVDVYFGYYASGEIPYHHLTAGVNKNATGTFSANITNLLGGTKYYFAAFATNGVDIWSTVSPLEFTTDNYPYVTSRDTMNTIIAYVVLLVIILLCIVVALSPIDSIIKLFAIITLILFFIIFDVLFNALGFIF
jgi:hypothetical protein